MVDTINIEILEDGTVKFDTDKISDVNHVSADAFMEEVEKLLGGTVEVKSKRRKGHVHTHTHQKA